MRTLTAQQLATLGTAAGYSTRARVQVERGLTWYDLTAMLGLGLDYLEEVTWSQSMEGPAGTAQVRLLREVNGWSCAPLRTDSPLNLPSGVYNPLLREGRRFKVELAVVPLGMQPTSSDWVEVFLGEIDEVDAAEEVLFSGRDYGMARCQDTFIETEVEYGSDLGTDVQTVMQEILDDNGLSAFLLYTPTSPAWALKRFVQKGESVADALKKLSTQLGWEVRWKWRSTGAGTGEWRLTLWSPDRSATVPVVSYAPGEYERLGEVRTSREDVRNAFEGVYSDRADLDVTGNPKRKTVTDSDATSIAAYGRRFMRIAEGATSNIDTGTEMANLLARAKADLKDPPLGVAVEVLPHPGLELGDLVELLGNDVHFTAAQAAAIQSLSCTVNSSGMASMKMTLVGKPSLARRSWVDLEQRPQVAPVSPFTGPNAPTGLTSSTTPNGFMLRFDPPTVGPVAAAYELHVSTSSSFTPTSATRRVVGSLSEMVATNLLPGTTYYAKVVPRDAKGNRGTASSEVTLVPRYVEPRTLQPRITYGFIPLNGDFEAANDGGAPPDAWRINVGATWGVDAQTTTDVYSGGTAILFPNTGVTTILSGQLFTVREGEAWVFSCFYKQSVGGSNSGVLTFTYLDSSFGTLSSTSVTLNGAAGVWTRAAQRVAIPSGARFAEVSVTKLGAYAGTLTVDSMDALRAVAWGAWTNLSYSNGWTDANLGVYGNAQHRSNDLGEVELRGVILSPSPAPAANATAFTLPVGARPSDFARVFDRLTSAGGTARFTFSTTGAVQVAAVAAAVDISLDGIRYFIS